MLYLVSTPIGNLEDITLRALQTLKDVDIVAAEDTRHSQKLFSHYDIHTPLISYHEHNKEKQAAYILSQMKQGKKIALITDAGTPCVSDPGFHLVRLAHENQVPVVVIPGPCAAIAALTSSGFPTDKFFFMGFLSVKPGKRKHQLEEAQGLEATIVVYEAPHRLLKLIQAIADVFGDIDVAVCRELTKKFEESATRPALEWVKILEKQLLRGEMVVLFRNRKARVPSLRGRE